MWRRLRGIRRTAGTEGLGFDALLDLLALFLVALNSLFVAAEFGLVHAGRRSAGLLKEATGRLDAYLSACQLGITISSLGLGWIGEPAFKHLLEPLFLSYSFRMQGAQVVTSATTLQWVQPDHP